MDYQKLFKYMSEEHGVTLLETDMQEICNIVNEMQNNALHKPPVIGSLPRNITIYRKAKSMEYPYFSQWLNKRLGR